jgi:hypothetical protein
VNKVTREDAIQDAILAFGSDCEIVTTFQNSCVAYAADHKTNSAAFGYGQGSDVITRVNQLSTSAKRAEAAAQSCRRAAIVSEGKHDDEKHDDEEPIDTSTEAQKQELLENTEIVYKQAGAKLSI